MCSSSIFYQTIHNFSKKFQSKIGPFYWWFTSNMFQISLKSFNDCVWLYTWNNLGILLKIRTQWPHHTKIQQVDSNDLKKIIYISLRKTLYYNWFLKRLMLFIIVYIQFWLIDIK